MPKEELNLPLSIFDNQELSALETICKYLREEKNYRYSKIASLLNRDQRTIWVTYRKAAKKRESHLTIADSIITLPITIFQNRNMSVLEAIVGHLKDNYNLKYSEIARLIRRDERNIWAIYRKAGIKQKNEQN
jgi:hypothetical protein